MRENLLSHFNRMNAKNIVQEDIRNIITSVPELKKFEGKTVLITGGCGFLGSWFVAIFQELNKSFKRKCGVVVVDSFIATDKKNHITEITDLDIVFLQNDINNSDIEQLALASRDGEEPLRHFDYIIHAAGLASPIYYRKYPIETIEGMAMGLMHLMKYAVKHPIESMLVFSSSEIYGNPHTDAVPTPESYNGNVSCTGPRSCYDESKRLEETICVAYHKIHNVPVKWVRPFNISGPGMRVKDDRVVPKFMFQALQGKPLTVHLPSMQTRTFCYITDAMIGFFKTLLIGQNGEVYNIGHTEPEISMQELALRIQKMVPRTSIENVEMPQEYPRDQAQRRCPDISKAKIGLGYTPQVNLDEGLRRMKIWCEEALREVR